MLTFKKIRNARYISMNYDIIQVQFIVIFDVDFHFISETTHIFVKEHYDIVQM